MEYQYHYGKRFYLDKETGYWISSECPKIRAHVFVWEWHHGERPKGLHVHHKDHDKSNNKIENLELIGAAEHLQEHMTPERRELCRKRMPMLQELAKEWHASADGREWHRNHAKKTLPIAWAMRYPIKCAVCGVEHEGKKPTQRFCSNNCKSELRRREGLDNVEVECPVCKKSFTKNKYARAKTCGRLCGQKLKKSCPMGKKTFIA